MIRFGGAVTRSFTPGVSVRYMLMTACFRCLNHYAADLSDRQGRPRTLPLQGKGDRRAAADEVLPASV